jgi:hypothetical protein
MIPLWILTALAGLIVGMVYAWWANKHARKQPIRRLNRPAVEEITGLLERRKHVRAVKLLRAATGLAPIDARNRISTWNADEERGSAA